MVWYFAANVDRSMGCASDGGPANVLYWTIAAVRPGIPVSHMTETIDRRAGEKRCMKR
jgi:hypothetical protein